MSLSNDTTPACDPCQINTTPCSTDSIKGLNSDPFVHSTISCVPNIHSGYYIQDFLQPMQGKMLPMYKSFLKGYPSIAQLLFDYDEQLDMQSGKAMQRLTFKSFPNLQLAPFQDGNFTTWGERYFKPQEFFVTQDYGVPTQTFEVGIPDGLGGYIPTLGSNYQNTSGVNQGRGTIGTKDVILIYRNDVLADDPCCEQMVQACVTAAGTPPNTITIEGSTGYIFKAGDRIVILYHGRNDCDLVDNTFGLIPTTAKRSYAQHFGYQIQFKKCELNQAYASEGAVKDFIAQRMFHANLKMIREMGYSMWRGRNRGNICGGQMTCPAETQGIITGMYDAQSRNPSLNLITSMHNMTSDDDKVRHILEQILLSQNSGVFPRGEIITLVCNDKAITALLKMNSAWNKFTGVQVQSTNNVLKSFALPMIQTPNGTIEILQDSLLSEMYPNEGVIVFLPKSLIGLRTRENQSIQIESGGINKATLGFTFEDVTQPGQHECRNYDVITEAAYIIGGFDAGAIRMVQGLRVC